MQYSYLNQYIAPGSVGYTEAWTRVLSRLGEYSATIINSLNMRPDKVSLMAQTAAHVLVRISTPWEHLVLRIAPETHLLSEVFFGRTAAQHTLPTARVVLHDLRRSLVPFDYMLEHYVCGIGGHQLDPDEPHLLRAVARQTGRTLRRMHRVRVDGWGHPTVNNRWLIPDWKTLLVSLHETHALPSIAALLFSSEEQAAVGALLSHPALYDTQPVLMHGAIGPQTVRCTVGEHVQLEALVDPGAVVAGDGLLDLAQGLNPLYPTAWCTGLIEGYTAVTPLSTAEWERLRLLQLLVCYWHTCQQYARAEPHEDLYDRTLTLLAEHRTLIDSLMPED
jgi:hypothetical protein